MLHSSFLPAFFAHDRNATSRALAALLAAFIYFSFGLPCLRPLWFAAVCFWSACLFSLLCIPLRGGAFPDFLLSVFRSLYSLRLTGEAVPVFLHVHVFGGRRKGRCSFQWLSLIFLSLLYSVLFHFLYCFRVKSSCSKWVT